MHDHDDILDFNYDDQYQKPSYQYAGFWIRVGASLIDGLIFLVIGILNLYNILSFKSLLLELSIAVVYLVYKPFFEYQYGATLGKMAVKIRVIDTEGGPIDVQQAIIRNIPYMLIGAVSVMVALQVFLQPGFNNVDTFAEYTAVTEAATNSSLNIMINLFYLISCLFVAFRANRQALHDSMAGTYCIHN